MVILIWIQTGFAMVILSGALRGIPEETIEAAVIDGANPFQIFFKIKVPQIMGTIIVVFTTITIGTLKIFDIVYAMTDGHWHADPADLHDVATCSATTAGPRRSRSSS